MRGLYSSKTKIRHQIFTEIARLAYEGDIEKEMDDLPYKILPGEIATYRDSIFLERAVVGERLRNFTGYDLVGKLFQHLRRLAFICHPRNFCKNFVSDFCFG